MSRYVGLLMIISGIFIFMALSLKLLFQPFIPKEHYIHSYFPSTEIVLGIPILCGTAFFAGFGKSLIVVCFIFSCPWYLYHKSAFERQFTKLLAQVKNYQRNSKNVNEQSNSLLNFGWYRI